MNCSGPSPVAGVTLSPFSDTTEGANISFNCELGLEPQRDDVSVCSSNGSWVPNPAHRICSTPPPSEWVIIIIPILYVYLLSYYVSEYRTDRQRAIAT